jgi:glutamate synthase domain-containing protein 2
LLKFIENLRNLSGGKPTGFKLCVGKRREFLAICKAMVETGIYPDYIAIDGGEGGTGAAPLAFTDNVSLPFMLGFAEVIRAFGQRDLQRRVAFAGSGRLGLPARAIEAFALGCDWINVGREAMLSVGCIQAQRCHTGRCPTGVATQNRWLERGIDVEDKSTRTERFIIGLRDEIVALARAAGAVHPAALDPRSVTILDGHDRTQSVAELFGVRPEWSLSSTEVLADLLAQWPPQLAAGAVS